jgi:hypothetical protein
VFGNIGNYFRIKFNWEIKKPLIELLIDFCIFPNDTIIELPVTQSKVFFYFCGEIMNLKIKNEFKTQFPYFKLSHYMMMKYLINWIISDNPPKIIRFDKCLYFWVSLKKLSDDLDLSKKIVRNSLYRLENKDKNINYNENEPVLFSKVVYEKERQTKLYLTFNYNIIENMFENGEEIMNLVSKKMEVDMPALFDMKDIEKKKYSENAEKIVRDILSNNSDLFKTRICKSKTFDKCCVAVQDIYNGQFTNPHIYDISRSINTNQFDYEGWREKVNSVKNDWTKVKELLEKAIGNYRLMFDRKNMPSNKKYLPDSLDKWFYDELNDGYPSYFVFSLRKPKPQKIQYADNNADKIFDELPARVQDIGNEIVNDCIIGNDYILWKNLKEMYGWCRNVFGNDNNIGYWVSSPSEIISKFVDYCDINNVQMNEFTFDVQNALRNNAPFAWFISDAVNKHKLNKKILKPCA